MVQWMYDKDPYRSPADMPEPEAVVAEAARLVKVVPLESGRFALHVILPGRRRWWQLYARPRPRLAIGEGTSWSWGELSERHNEKGKLVTTYRVTGGTPCDADALILTAMWEDYVEDSSGE